jgi:predicted RNA-binding protein with PIN domain
MSYLIDGNNVMAQRVGWHRDKPGARRRLLGELAAYARAARVSMSVVFDGAPEEHFPDGASFMGVSVFYAVRGSNADERIKRMVEESRERRTLVVVTSDRALAEYVRSCGARVVRAGEFRRRLDETAATESEQQSARKERRTAKPSSKELDQWMRYFGVDETEEKRKDEG